MCDIAFFRLPGGTKRRKSEGRANAKDDDGIPLSGDLDYLEVAHIVPRSLMRPQEGSEVRFSGAIIFQVEGLI